MIPEGKKKKKKKKEIKKGRGKKNELSVGSLGIVALVVWKKGWPCWLSDSVAPVNKEFPGIKGRDLV